MGAAALTVCLDPAWPYYVFYVHAAACTALYVAVQFRAAVGAYLFSFQIGQFFPILLKRGVKLTDVFRLLREKLL